MVNSKVLLLSMKENLELLKECVLLKLNAQRRELGLNGDITGYRVFESKATGYVFDENGDIQPKEVTNLNIVYTYNNV